MNGPSLSQDERSQAAGIGGWCGPVANDVAEVVEAS
jgi:hypothetical protein